MSSRYDLGRERTYGNRGRHLQGVVAQSPALPVNNNRPANPSTNVAVLL